MGRKRSAVGGGLRRDVRALSGWAGIGLLGLAVAVVLAGRGAAVAQPEPDAAVLAEGAVLYAANCAACHGPRGAGGPGERGLTAGLPVAGIERAYVDQQMRTGRMPLIDRTAGVVRPRGLADDEREAVLAWMTAELGLVGEIPALGEGDASRGQELYTVHCAACHGSVGNGGIAGAGTVALTLRGVDPVAMAEAIRVGPYSMPAFGEELLSAQDVDDITTFTAQELEAPRRSLLGLTEQNRVGLAALALLLVGGVVGGAVLVARPVPVPTRRSHD